MTKDDAVNSNGDRQWFVEQNAVVLLRERDEKIKRMGQIIQRLERSRASLRQILRQRAADSLKGGKGEG